VGVGKGRSFAAEVICHEDVGAQVTTKMTNINKILNKIIYTLINRSKLCLLKHSLDLLIRVYII
jgi:hypothetical protein